MGFANHIFLLLLTIFFIACSQNSGTQPNNDKSPQPSPESSTPGPQKSPAPQEPACTVVNSIEALKINVPDYNLFSTFNEIADGPYVLTQFQIYFTEYGRESNKGEAGLIYQLNHPGKLDTHTDFFQGISKLNDATLILKKFNLNIQIDDQPEITQGHLVFNPMVTLHVTNEDKGRQVVLSRPVLTDKPAQNLQDLFQAKRWYAKEKSFVLTNGWFGVTESSTFGSVLKTPNGFELYVYPKPNLWGQITNESTLKLVYEKRGAAAVIQCPASQSQIQTPSLLVCGQTGTPVCAETRTLRGNQWSLIARTNNGSEIWKDNKTQLIWSERNTTLSTYRSLLNSTSCAQYMTNDQLGNLAGKSWDFPSHDDFKTAHENGLFGILFGKYGEVFYAKSPNSYRNLGYCFGNEIKPCETFQLEANIVCISK